MKKSRTAIAASILPGLLLLVLFYSLALHMRLSLGAWPGPNDERGFPRGLSLHTQITVDYFILSLLGLLALPLPITVCLLRKKWQRFVPYIALFALAFLVSLALMQLAPGQFLYWWRD